MAGRHRCGGCGDTYPRRDDLSSVSRLCVLCSAERIINNVFGISRPGSAEWHRMRDAQRAAAKAAPIDPKYL